MPLVEQSYSVAYYVWVGCWPSPPGKSASHCRKQGSFGLLTDVAEGRELQESDGVDKGEKAPRTSCENLEFGAWSLFITASTSPDKTAPHLSPATPRARNCWQRCWSGRETRS